MTDNQKSAVERLAEDELKRRKEKDVVRGVAIGIAVLFIWWQWDTIGKIANYLVGGN